jgi:hypothetical protein
MEEYPYHFAASAGQAYTTEADSTYSFDLEATGKYIGNQSTPIVFRGRVKTAFTGAASGVRAFVNTSDSADASSDRTVAAFVSENMTDEGYIPVTDLDAIGDEIYAVIPPNIPCLRYLHIHVTPVSEALATGYIDFTMEVGAGEAGDGCVA